MHISLRGADVADEAFLLTLYASTRADNAPRVDWTPELKGAFLEMQFNAQRQYYLGQYPRAEYYMIEQERRPIGRMIVDRSKHAIRLRPVQLHVDECNRAKSLYKRLGFVETGEMGIYREMTRQPKVGAYA
jgi:hypothetical protein